MHKAEHLEARMEMMQWWSDYLDVSREGYVAPIFMHGGIKRPDQRQYNSLIMKKLTLIESGSAFCIERIYLQFFDC